MDTVAESEVFQKAAGDVGSGESSMNVSSASALGRTS